MKPQFVFFEDSWNMSDDETKALPKDEDGDDDGVDEYFSPSEYKKNTWEYEDGYEEYGH